MKLRGIRGAITVDRDGPEEISVATRELLEEMVRANSVEKEDIASVFFSLTPDLASAFPAKAARDMDWRNVPLFCVQELAVNGALPRCIRVLIHWNTDRAAREVRHVYLREAVVLRPDLSSP